MNRHWTSRLGDHCDFVNGGTPSKGEERFWNGDIPWITSADIADGNVLEARSAITEEALERSATNLVPPSTILLVSRTGVGKVAQAPVALAFSQDITAIVPRSGSIDARYLFRFLETRRPEFERNARGATIKGITRELIASQPILLPPLDEQRRIAAILDKADALRQKRERAIALLDSLLDSVLEKAFSEVSANLTMADLFDVQGGLQLSRSRAALPLKAPYLRVANVYRDALDLSEIKLMGMTEAELTRTRLVAGDILFVEGHGNADQVGRSAVWDGSVAGCSHQNHLIRARTKLGSVEPKVISRWLNSRLGRKHLLKRGKTTSGLNTIRVSDVRAAPVPRLSTEEYGLLRRQIDLLETRRSSMLTEMAKLSSLFASLQNRAFSGQL